MLQLLEKLKQLTETLVNIDQKLGFRKFSKYILFLAITAFLVINHRGIAAHCIDFVQSISDEVHAEKMQLRDEYMKKLNYLLVEFRTDVDADRVMYFEYHNSEENLNGLPFKFFDLMIMNSKYSIPSVSPKMYQDVNASVYIDLLTKLDEGKFIWCKGLDDVEFRKDYKGFIELLNSTDGTNSVLLFSVPGVTAPIGFIAVEWVKERDNLPNVSKEQINRFLPRMNALCVSVQERL